MTETVPPERLEQVWAEHLKGEFETKDVEATLATMPEDLLTTTVNRVVGVGQLVDELHSTFTHSRPMPWFLPGVAPTQKKIETDIVVVVQFRGDKLACERIYWDHAAVLRQVGLLKS